MPHAQKTTVGLTKSRCTHIRDPHEVNEPTSGAPHRPQTSTFPVKQVPELKKDTTFSGNTPDFELKFGYVPGNMCNFELKFECVPGNIRDFELKFECVPGNIRDFELSLTYVPCPYCPSGPHLLFRPCETTSIRH